MLLLHADSIDLGFNSWSKNGWQKGLGKELNRAKDQVFDLGGGLCVRLSYVKGRDGMLAQLKPIIH